MLLLRCSVHYRLAEAASPGNGYHSGADCPSSRPAGCGSADTGSTTTTDTGSAQSAPAQSADATDATGDVPTVKIAYNIMFPATDEQAIEDAINKIMVEKAGAKVAGLAFVIELVDLKGRELLKGYNLLSLTQFEGE